MNVIFMFSMTILVEIHTIYVKIQGSTYIQHLPKKYGTKANFLICLKTKTKADLKLAQSWNHSQSQLFKMTQNQSQEGKYDFMKPKPKPELAFSPVPNMWRPV